MADNLEQEIADGKQLHRAGRLDEAKVIYQRVLNETPDNPDALHLLGVIASTQGDHQKSQDYISRAIKYAPKTLHYHNNLGLALLELGREIEAEQAFKVEIERSPNHVVALSNLGSLLQKRGCVDEALDLYLIALKYDSKNITILNNLAAAMVVSERYSEAEQICRDILLLQPKNAEAVNLLGVVALSREQYKDAIECYRKAIQINPDLVDAHHNLGVVYHKLGEFSQSVQAFDRALKIDHVYSKSRFSRSRVNLLLGNYSAGWDDYEYGLVIGEREIHSFEFPAWKGEKLTGKGLLICAEQGLGDEIIFASIIQEIIEEADSCVIECDSKLITLYERSFPLVTIISRDDYPPPSETLKNVDYFVAVGSLACFRRRKREEFPRQNGYLFADHERVAFWGDRLGLIDKRLKVGISWRGGTPKTGMHLRSTSLNQILPILRCSGATFVSLQYTDCKHEIDDFSQSTGITIHHWQDAIDDYDETAALVEALDLVITVTTAIVDLCGAVGKRAWVMTPEVPEWRFGVSGESMPWYPSVKIFRQSAAGDWDSLAINLAENLSHTLTAMDSEAKAVSPR